MLRTQDSRREYPVLDLEPEFDILPPGDSDSGKYDVVDSECFVICSCETESLARIVAGAIDHFFCQEEKRRFHEYST